MPPHLLSVASTFTISDMRDGRDSINTIILQEFKNSRSRYQDRIFLRAGHSRENS